MAGSPETSAILDALNPTRTSARERQGETERRIREEARRLAAEGGLAGGCSQLAMDFSDTKLMSAGALLVADACPCILRMQNPQRNSIGSTHCISKCKAIPVAMPSAALQ